MFFSYCILFFIFSFLGWLMEVVLTYITDKRLVNRGFLLGPYCPIYGLGCITLYISLSNYTNNLLVLFILTLFTCSLLEYLTSYVMEKIFNLRWWDYSHMKYNINGRICLETMVPFSILGVLTIKYAIPFFLSIINKLSIQTKLIISIILISILTIDVFVSIIIVFKLKIASNNIKEDQTYDIKQAIKETIKSEKYIYKRVLKAFPHLLITLKDKSTSIIDKYKHK